MAKSASKTLDRIAATRAAKEVQVVEDAAKIETAIENGNVEVIPENGKTEAVETTEEKAKRTRTKNPVEIASQIEVNAGTSFLTAEQTAKYNTFLSTRWNKLSDKATMRTTVKNILANSIPSYNSMIAAPTLDDESKEMARSMRDKAILEVSFIADLLGESGGRTKGYVKHLVPVTYFTMPTDTAVLEAIEGKFFTINGGKLFELPTTVKNKVGEDCPLKIMYAGMKSKEDETLEEGKEVATA